MESPNTSFCTGYCCFGEVVRDARDRMGGKVGKLVFWTRRVCQESDSHSGGADDVDSLGVRGVLGPTSTGQPATDEHTFPHLHYLVGDQRTATTVSKHTSSIKLIVYQLASTHVVGSTRPVWRRAGHLSNTMCIPCKRISVTRPNVLQVSVSGRSGSRATQGLGCFRCNNPSF